MDSDNTADDWLDSEQRLMRVLLEQLGSLPAEHRIEIASAFYAHLGHEDDEDSATWRNTYRKQLALADGDEIDRARIEAALRAKRADRW